MDREKFQQKALKQTKQKKSKSAEFLMVKEDREAIEGFGNPAFSMSNPDLSAHQTSEEKIIRHDTPDRILAAHQQKSRLPVSAELKGNEYSRNYFDPLMDEEINPRQCGMEVSREDESNTEETLDSEALTSFCKRSEIHKQTDEAAPEFIEEWESHAQKDVILLGSSPFEQDVKSEEERFNQYLPMSRLKMDKTLLKAPSQPSAADLPVGEKHSVTKLGSLTEVTHSCMGAAGSCWEVEQSQSPQLLQIQITCIRGLKDKAPRGSYLLKVSLLSRLGGCDLQCWQTEQLRIRTQPVRHDGNFYSMILCFHESLSMGLPQKKDVKPGMALLFELCLLHGKSACADQAVGWAAFPLCDNSFGIVEGKFKCPLLRGHYEQKLSSFREIEDLICLDLDHWLCNLYFQMGQKCHLQSPPLSSTPVTAVHNLQIYLSVVVKSPFDHVYNQKLHESPTRLSPEFSVCFTAEAEKANLGMGSPAGSSGKETQKDVQMSMERAAEPLLHASQGPVCSVLRRSKVMVADSPSLLREPGNMWKELLFPISQLAISSAGQPLTPRRHADTHEGSVPTDVKEEEELNNLYRIMVSVELLKLYKLLKGHPESARTWAMFGDIGRVGTTGIPYAQSRYTAPRGTGPLWRIMWSKRPSLGKPFVEEVTRSISNKTDPCPTDCDLSLLKEDHELHSKGDSLAYHFMKEKSTACRPGEFEDYSHDTSYLEELEKHRFSVWARGSEVTVLSVIPGRRCIVAEFSELQRLCSQHVYIFVFFQIYAQFCVAVGPPGCPPLCAFTPVSCWRRCLQGTKKVDTFPVYHGLSVVTDPVLATESSASVAGSSGPGPGGLFKHLHFVRMSVFSELQFAQWQSPGFWYTLLLMASLCFLRLCLHYFGQWLFLQAISTPVTKFHLYPYTVELCYQWSSLSIAEELAVIVAGPLMLNAVVFLLVLIRWGCQLLFASCPDVLSKLIITMGLWTVLDPPAVFVVDTFLGRLVHSEEAPTADAAKLYWMFVRSQQSGILGASITVLLYIFLFIISSLIFYMYCLRLHNDSWISDAFQRIHSEETKFFMPYDLEISNQELSYIVKRSEQWRGINGERRKVAVYDYIRRSPGIKSSVSSCDLPHQNEISVSAFGPGDVTSHVSVYTVYPSGFQKLYRHFLRLPSGAIVEVFGDISALQFVPSEVTTAIQEHISGMDTVLRDSCPTHPRDMNGIQ
nr:uncharacterized protein LOC101787516 [Cavia porcellus]